MKDQDKKKLKIEKSDKGYKITFDIENHRDFHYLSKIAFGEYMKLREQDKSKNKGG